MYGYSRYGSRNRTGSRKRRTSVGRRKVRVTRRRPASVGRRRTYGTKRRRSTNGSRKGSRKSTKRTRISSGPERRFKDVSTNVHKGSGPKKWVRGCPRSGPADKYLFTSGTSIIIVAPSSRTITYGGYNCDGTSIATLLANIRTESPYTLIGTTALLQPTLYVRCMSQAVIYNSGNATLKGSYVVVKSRVASVSEHSVPVVQYLDQYARQYDKAPTAFTNFYTNKILPCGTYFGTNGRQRVVGKEVSFSLRTGQRKVITVHNSIKLTYADYAAIADSTTGGSPTPSPLSAANGGYFKNKTYTVFVSLSGEQSQLCGTLALENTPLLTSNRGAGLMMSRAWYQYKWAPGNNRPSYYGSILGAGETVSADAYGWIGIPESKSMRFAGGNTGDSTSWGGLDGDAKFEVDINPTFDCTGDRFTPSVSILP